MSSSKAIIIGSGVAGLASAIRLAVEGFDVHVYEANSYPGGKLSSFEKDGFRFDAGPSLFTQPQNIEELFTLANETIEDYFNYQPVDVVCHYFFENGKQLKTYADKELLATTFQEVLGEDRNAVIDYLNNAEKLYNNIGTIFLNHSLHQSKTWLHTRVINALKNVKWSYLFGTLHQHNKTKFKTEEAVQLFNRFATYNGSNPYKAPGMLSLIPHLEQNQGTFYPKGGMISITNALYNLALKKGVQFHFNKKVTSIVQEQKQVKGIVVDNENIIADIVVSNGDVYYTYKKLLNENVVAHKISKLERSSSALIFYWGIQKEFSELGLHNIFFSNDYKKEFEHLFEKKTLIDDPTVYINITSKMENNHALEGSENWFVMINAPAMQGADWDEEVKRVRGCVITKLNRMLGVELNDFIAV